MASEPCADAVLPLDCSEEGMARIRLSTPTRFQGAKVLITGGSSGIGYQLAADFLRLGARVYTVSDGRKRFASSLAALKSISPDIEGEACDIGDPAAVSAMGERVLARFGCPDILVNNAGWSSYRTFEQTPGAELESMASVNFTGPLRVTLAFLAAMKARGSGHIVNMSSIGGKIVLTPHSIYSAAKFGTTAWSEALAHELRPFGIDVTVVIPGKVKTAFHDHETFSQREMTPETKLGMPVERACADILRGIDRRAASVYTPGWLRFVAWGYAAFPILARPVFRYLIHQRIKAYYRYRGETLR